MKYMFIKQYKCVKQHDISDCAAAVSTILVHYGLDISIIKLREIMGTDVRGTTVKGVVMALNYYNFETKAIRTDAESLEKGITLPAIAQVTTKEGLLHFLVIHKITKKGYFIVADPAKGLIKMTREEFEEIFSGILIMMVPKSNFEKMNLKTKGLQELFGQLILSQKQLIIVIILCSLVLSIIGIALSTSSKVLMDEIIAFQMKNILILFLFGYGLVIIIQSILSAFRQHIILFLSRKIDIPVLMGYYDHILHLPYSFFVSRKTGDIITRFQDAMTIKDIFTTASISLVLDIGLSIISAIVLCLINSTLFVILLGMVCINVILVYFFKKPYKKINYEQMEASSKLNSHFIESIKNISD